MITAHPKNTSSASWKLPRDPAWPKLVQDIWGAYGMKGMGGSMPGG